jgi:hypothetical protein
LRLAALCFLRSFAAIFKFGSFAWAWLISDFPLVTQPFLLNHSHSYEEFDFPSSYHPTRVP